MSKDAIKSAASSKSCFKKVFRLCWTDAFTVVQVCAIMHVHVHVADNFKVVQGRAREALEYFKAVISRLGPI